jgi:hypothetical protein
MADGGILDVDRGDPLATRLDDVLGPVDDSDETVGVDRHDITGAEPAFLVDRRLRSGLVVEIALHDPRASHEQLAALDAVMRQPLAVGVDDL